VADIKAVTDDFEIEAAEHEVTGIPTPNVYRNGGVVRQAVGARPKAALLHELSDSIS
jgi:thioredoxin 1